MPKVVIVCGPDNVGKDTLINKLSNDYFNSSIVMHSCAPTSDDLFGFYFDGLIHDTLGHYYHSKVDAIIHNRSMYGEYVYGPKYRNEDKCSIEKLINRLEVGQLKTFILERNLIFILLTSDNAQLLSNNSDGKSFSDNVNDIAEEIKAFDEIFNKSIIKNKHKVLVNNNNEFRDKLDIYNEVIEFIKSCE